MQIEHHFRRRLSKLVIHAICEDEDEHQNWLSVGLMEQGRKFDVNNFQNQITHMNTIKNEPLECTKHRIHMHTLK